VASVVRSPKGEGKKTREEGRELKKPLYEDPVHAHTSTPLLLDLSLPTTTSRASCPSPRHRHRVSHPLRQTSPPSPAETLPQTRQPLCQAVVPRRRARSARGGKADGEGVMQFGGRRRSGGVTGEDGGFRVGVGVGVVVGVGACGWGLGKEIRGGGCLGGGGRR
jgi:hypothetical protein